jgi:hypothetical protein
LKTDAQEGTTKQVRSLGPTRRGTPRCDEPEPGIDDGTPQVAGFGGRFDETGGAVGFDGGVAAGVALGLPLADDLGVVFAGGAALGDGFFFFLLSSSSSEKISEDSLEEGTSASESDPESAAPFFTAPLFGITNQFARQLTGADQNPRNLRRLRY